MKSFTMLAALLWLGVSSCGCGGGATVAPPQDGAVDAAGDGGGPVGPFTISGSTTGLAGTGLVLQNNGGDDLAVTANGEFSFARALVAGATYAVTVKTQPATPTQTCTVTNGTGTVGATDVTSVTVTCATDTFTVGGTATGLTGAGLVLENNGTDALTVLADGTFTFATALASGTAFAVTVAAQPSNPAQTCTVSGASGTVGAGDVTSVVVNCATDTFTVGGQISGLSGTVVLQNNDGDDLTLTANGAFAFATTVASGAAYAVTVLTQPSAPSQTCTVTAGTGTVATADVTSVRVICVTDRFTVGGTVSGLTGAVLVLQSGGGDNLAVTADGDFTFPTPVASGAAYAVTVLVQPSSPTQTCTVARGSGTMGGADVTDVAVTCATSAFTVGGTVSGLAGAGLVLQNSGGDDLTISANGSFTFTTSVLSGATYAVTVAAQPSAPTQTCVVSAGSGTVGAGNVTSVAVNCATSTYTIGGSISGLAGMVVLRNNGADDLTLYADGSFAFATPVASGAAYAVTVLTHPATPSQTCTVTSGSGTIDGANVTDIVVTCTTAEHTIGGTVSGLAGTGLVLQNNGGDGLAISADGDFTFTVPVASGAAYEVTAAAQPTGLSQTCVVTSGTGVVGAANVTGVVVTCTTNTYLVGGTVTGLAGGGLVLQNEGDDDLAIVGNGAFSFATRVASGAPYAVTAFAQPNGPSQTCLVTAGGGTVTSADVTSVVVTCTTNQYTVGGSVSGLTGTGLVLQNNAGDDLALTANGTFTFSTAVASGATFAVTILTPPSGPMQACTVSGGSGTVGGAAVTSVAVNCATNTYTIGGTVTGLVGTGLVLQNNGGDDLAVSANGSFAFATAIASGAPYAVTTLANPGTPWQTCAVTNGSDTVGGANVTSVVVTCTTDRYTIGGRLVGLTAGNTIALLDNGADYLALTADGDFTFATPVASGLPYAVTVLTQPAAQTCVISGGAGTVANTNVTDVVVTCALPPPIFDSMPVQHAQSIRGAGDSCGTLLSVSADAPLARIGVKNDLDLNGNLKFMIWTHPGHVLVYISPPTAFVDDGNTWKVSDPFSYTLAAGQSYDIGAIADVGGRWDYDIVVENVPPFLSRSNNPNWTNYATPVISSAGGADCAIRLYDK